MQATSQAISFSSAKRNTPILQQRGLQIRVPRADSAPFTGSKLSSGSGQHGLMAVPSPQTLLPNPNTVSGCVTSNINKRLIMFAQISVQVTVKVYACV